MSCPDCFKGAVHDYADPAGSEETIHGIRTYVSSGSQSVTQSSSRPTIIFITDAFGFNLVNSKLLADYYAAKTGFRVLVPDVMPGGGVPLHSLQLMQTVGAPTKWWDIPGQFWRAVSLVRMLAIFIPFATRIRRVFPLVLAYTRSVKAELPAGTKLGVAGFCVGEMFTTKLSLESAVDGGKDGLVDAHFTAHPSGLKGSDEFVQGVRKFNVPFSMAIGDDDMMLSRDAVAQIEARLREELGADDDNHFEVEVYPGCGHGFAVRADPQKTVENDAATKAADQAVSWFKRFLG
jgi:dienelactone hydrolase